MKSTLISQRRTLGLWLGLLLFTILVGRPSIWAIALGLYVSYLAFSPYLSASVFSSKLYRFIAVFLIYALCVQCVVVSLWAVVPGISLQQTPLITVVVLLGILAVLRKYGPAQPDRTAKEQTDLRFFHRYDIVALALALVIVSVIVVPSVFKTGYTRSNVVKLVNTNVDDASHLSLLNDHIARDRGVLTGVADPEKLRNTTMYPAGWHSFNTILIRAAIPTIQTGNATLLAFIFTKVAWFAALIYLAFRFGLQLWARHVRKGSLSVVECLAFAIITGYFVQVYIHVFMEGFYSFIPQIMYGILLLSLIGQLNIRKKTNAVEPGFATTLPLLFIVAIGGGLAWFLPVPGLAAFLAILAGSYVWGSRWVANSKTLILSSLPFLPIYLLTAVATLVQSYILAHDTSAGAVAFLESLLLRGGITIYDPTFYLAFGVGVFAFFVMVRRSRNVKDNFAYGSLLLFVCMLGFMSAVYMYQQLKIGANVYYYHKLLYLLLAMATPLAIVGYAYLVRLVAVNNTRVLLHAALLLFVLVNFVGIEPTMTKSPVYNYPAYLVGRRKVPALYNEVIYQNLRNVSTEDAVNDKNYYFFYTLDQNQMDTPSMLLKSNKPFSSCYESVRGSFLRADSIYHTDRAARKDCKGKNIYLIANDEDREAIAKLGLKKLKTLSYGQAKGYVPF